MILQGAAESGNLDVFNRLLSQTNGWQLNQQINWYFVLEGAARGGNTKIIEVILRHYKAGVYDFNMMVLNGAKHGHLELVKDAILRGADKFDEALVEASMRGLVDIVQLLVTRVSENFIDDALVEAVRYGHLSVIKELVKYGDLTRALLYAPQKGRMREFFGERDRQEMGKRTSELE